MIVSQEKYKKIHFIGIGGIGVSALARYYLAQGFEVSGSDATESEIVADLIKLGAKINIGHKSALDSRHAYRQAGSCGNDTTSVIYSAAVPLDNLDLVEARKRGIKCQTYAEALGELTKKYFTIAVSGMHGKSTTTAMIGLILEAAGLDPTVIVGTRLKEWQQSNCRVGKSKYLVIEADEYNRSMLNYWPKIMVLTNLEEEHLDTYKDLDDILKTFKEYVGHLGKDGVLVANEEDENIKKIINHQFSIFKQFPSRKFPIKKYNASSLSSELSLKIPGKHNLSNAAAAIAVARLLNIADKISVKVLNNFSGTWRRMEYKGNLNGAKIYDDYAHHPTEIKATLAGAKELLGKNGQLWCVFQPHQYHRTHDLFKQFIEAFADADKTIILPIYSVAGREKESIKKKVNSEKLVKAINNDDRVVDNRVSYLDSFSKAEKHLKKNLKKGDVCLIMGAGDIYKLTEELL